MNDIEVFAKGLIEKYKIWSLGKVDSDIETTTAKQCAIQSCKDTIEELKLADTFSQGAFIKWRIRFLEQVIAALNK